MSKCTEALLDATLTAVPSSAPGEPIRTIAAGVAGFGFEAVRTALRQLRRKGLVRARGARSHFLYCRVAPDDPDAAPDDDEGRAEPLASAPEPPPVPDVRVALAFLSARGFKVARHLADGAWIVGGQRMSPAAIVRQAELLQRPGRR